MNSHNFSKICAFVILILTIPINNLVWAQAITIDIESAMDVPKPIRISQIASNIEYIKLETNQNCNLGYTGKMEIYNEHVIVVYDAIYLFDTTGRFNCVLARKGKGPGEYLEFGGMTILPSNNSLYIQNKAKAQILRFDLINGYCGNINFKQGYSILPLDQEQYCCYFPTRFLGMSDFYSVMFHNVKGELIDKKIKNPHAILNDMDKIPITNNGMYRYNDSITMWDGYNNNIFRVSPDHNIIHKYTMDLGKQKLPNRLRNGIDSSKYWEEVNNYSFITKVFETDKYFFISCSHKGKFIFVLYDKQSKKTACMQNEKPFINDIDGGPDFWPHGRTIDGRIYRILQMSYLKSFYEENKTYNSELRQLVESSSDEDNPIIMLITLK